MDEKPKAVAEEIVVKEYPNSTRWLDGQQVIGAGNLILTSERLLFIHQVPLDEEDLERLQKLSGKMTASRMLDLALSLHKKNFQVLLSSVISVKTGLYSILPLPRPCLRIFYINEKKKGKTNELTFMFTIPLLKGFFQFEITTVQGWVWIIRKAVKRKQATT